MFKTLGIASIESEWNSLPEWVKEVPEVKVRLVERLSDALFCFNKGKEDKKSKVSKNPEIPSESELRDKVLQIVRSSVWRRVEYNYIFQRLSPAWNKEIFSAIKSLEDCGILTQQKLDGLYYITEQVNIPVTREMIREYVESAPRGSTVHDVAVQFRINRGTAYSHLVKLFNDGVLIKIEGCYPHRYFKIHI